MTRRESKRNKNIRRTSRRKLSESSTSTSTSKSKTRRTLNKQKSRKSKKNRATRTKIMTTARRSDSREKSGEKAFSKYPEKQQRQYEHKKETYLSKGTNEKRAKRIAAATVNKTRSLRSKTKK